MDHQRDQDDQRWDTLAAIGPWADIARAIIAVLQAPTEAIHDEVFNVGDTSHNYRVREIAEIVGEIFPDCRVSFGASGQDNRS
jgi:nucleoside-diphosphate-sugar epimerase